jgi:hypothetical protein
MNENWPAPDPDTAVVGCGHHGAELRTDSYYAELHGGRYPDGEWAWVVWCDDCDHQSYMDV